MSSTDEACFSLLLAALFALLLFLRSRYPNASRGAETAVLVGATILFFTICNSFLSAKKPAIRTVHRVPQAQESAFRR